MVFQYWLFLMVVIDRYFYESLFLQGCHNLLINQNHLFLGYFENLGIYWLASNLYELIIYCECKQGPGQFIKRCFWSMKLIVCDQLCLWNPSKFASRSTPSENIYLWNYLNTKNVYGYCFCRVILNSSNETFHRTAIIRWMKTQPGVFHNVKYVNFGCIPTSNYVNNHLLGSKL